MRPFLHQACDCLFFFFFFSLGKQTILSFLSPYRELLWLPVPTDFCRIVCCTYPAWIIFAYNKVKAHTVSNWISFMVTVVEFRQLYSFQFSWYRCCTIPDDADKTKNLSNKKLTAFAGHADYLTILFQFTLLAKFLKLETGLTETPLSKYKMKYWLLFAHRVV